MPDKACEKCGKIVTMRAVTDKYCRECAEEERRRRQREYDKAGRERRKNHQPVVRETMECERCGKTIERRMASQKYCPECSKEARREYMRAYDKERQARARLPKYMECEVCGRTIERKSHNQKYCPSCAKAEQRAREKEYDAEYKQVRQQLQQHREAQQQSARSLAQIAQEARACGMTYGAYTAALRSGTLEAILNRRRNNGLDN